MRFLAAILLAAALWLGLTWAGEAIPMSVAELTQHAELIVRGTVEGKEVKRDAERRIYTEIKLAVKEVWKGDPKKPLLKVVHGGGILGEEKAVAVGQVAYEPGEEVVGFFVWNDRGEAVTLSMSQGKFQVAHGADGDLEVNNPFMGRGASRNGTAAAGGNVAAGGKAKMSLEDLKTKVKEATK